MNNLKLVFISFLIQLLLVIKVYLINDDGFNLMNLLLNT